MRTHIIRLVVYLPLLCGLWGCAEEKELLPDHEYPLLQILSATADSTGIKVTAEVTKAGLAEIKEYGVSFHLQAKSQQESKLATPVVGNRFEAVLQGGLLRGGSYKINAYAIVNNKTVYSNSVLVTSIVTSQPVVTDINPQEQWANESVTISGDFFVDDKARVRVVLGATEATVLSADFNKIVFKVPDIGYSSYQPVRVIVDGVESNADKLFRVRGPEITGLSKYEALPGEIITLNGKDLMWGGSLPYVQLSNVAAFDVLEAANNNLKIKVPAVPNEKYDIPLPIILSAGLQSTISTFTFTVRSGFDAVAPLSLGSNSDYLPAFEAEGKGYFFDYNRVLSYSAATDTWQEESRFPGTARHTPVWERIGDKSYLIGGDTGSNEVWEYDFRARKWQQLPNLSFSVSSAGSFVLGGNLYFAGGLNSYSHLTLWKYDPVEQNITSLNPLPIGTSSGSFFVSKGKAYFAKDRTMYVYNQSADTWNFEGAAPFSNGFAFTTANDEVYILAKQYDAEFFHYKVSTKTWKKVAVYTGCKNISRVALFSGFTTGNVFYIGSFKANAASGNCHNNFYSYRP